MADARELPERDDETVRTILDRAARRARHVASQCGHGSVRPPAPGPTDCVDLERVRRLGVPRAPPGALPVHAHEPLPEEPLPEERLPENEVE